jgi:hypothetical protein
MNKWNNQVNNMSERFKVVVFFHTDQPKTSQTYNAFLSDEIKGIAIQKLTDRIINKLVFGKYKTAIFYDYGTEVQRWQDGKQIS